MKKKIFSLLFILLIIPCAILFTSCGKKEAEALTISFNLKTNTLLEQITVDNENKTISWVYDKSIDFNETYFDVVGTNVDGETQTIPKADETSLGYKVETDLPVDRTCVPAGTYSFKIYCEASDNGKIKFDACESVWTLNIKKKVIDCSNYGWSNNMDGDLVYTPGYTHQVFFGPLVKTGLVDFKDLEGVSNFEYDQSSTISATNAGRYEAKVKFDLDTNNYQFTNLADKSYIWTINKADPASYLTFTDFWGQIQNNHSVEYDPNGPISVYSQVDKDWTHPAGFKFTGNFEGTSITNVPGNYWAKPIFTEQTDTKNWLPYNIDYYKLDWSIVPKNITLSDISWNYTNPLTYNQGEQTVSLVGVPDLLVSDIEYTNNSATNAGTYNATATIVYDTTYYNVIGETSYNLTWKINPKDFAPDYINVQIGTNITPGVSDRTTKAGNTEIICSTNEIWFTVEYIIKDSAGEIVTGSGIFYNLQVGKYTVELTITIIGSDEPGYEGYTANNYTLENFDKSFTITVTASMPPVTA